VRDRTGQPKYNELGLTLELYQERMRLACLRTGLKLAGISKKAGLRRQLRTGELPLTSHMDRVCNFLGLNREQFCGPLTHFMSGLDAAALSGWHERFVAPRAAGLKFSKHPQFGTPCHQSDEPGEPWPMHFPIHARW
jgi:hypothetical protein